MLCSNISEQDNKKKSIQRDILYKEQFFVLFNFPHTLCVEKEKVF